jgi:hypothetical protein
LFFLSPQNPPPVPAAFARDDDAGVALYEWIEGVPVVAHSGDVAEALAFVGRLYTARFDPAAAALAPAAEAGLRIESVWEQIAKRADRLRACSSELSSYLDELTSLLSRERERIGARRDPDTELPVALRTLSPSDFGFHNALRRDDGLVFLDFEYFGWDDPVKLACDFALHPGMELGTADRKEWLIGMERTFSGDADFSARLDDCFPTYALKWCTILLNEFRPEIWSRRAAARRHAQGEAVLAQQLAKARALLERVRRGDALAG